MELARILSFSEALDPDATEFAASAEVTADPSVGDDAADELSSQSDACSDTMLQAAPSILPHFQCRDMEMYFRPRSESPDVFRSAGRPSVLKSAYDGSSDGQQHNETAPTSPSQRWVTIRSTNCAARFYDL